MPITQMTSVCPGCGIWDTATEDAYCGWCGHPVGRLQVKVSPSPLLRIHEIAQETNLLIENTTCGTVEVIGVRVTRGDWVSTDWDEPVSIPSGESYAQPLAIDTLNIAADSAEAEICIETALDNLGEGAQRLSLFAVGNALAPRLQPKELVVWKDDPNFSPYPLQIVLDHGQLNIHGLSVPRTNPVKLEPSSITGRVAKNAPLAFQLHVDRQRLFRLGKPPAAILTEVKVEYEDFDGPTIAKLPLGLRLAHPPELDIPEASRTPEFFKPGIAEFELRFHNRKPGDPARGIGNAPLRIVAIELDHPNEALKAQWAKQFIEPIEIAGGGAAQARFRLDVDSFSTEDIQTIRVLLRTNRTSLDSAWNIEFDLREIEEFTGTLALDFGTSNTCCSALGVGALEPEPIQIDGSASTSPTVLRYRSIQGEYADVEIGIRVKNADITHPRATVSRLKEKLGHPKTRVSVRPVESSRTQKREVRSAVIDYLREVRKAAELREHCYFRNFIVTHPAVCLLRQYRSLTYAVRQAFGGESAEITFLQEPVASLLPLIRTEAQSKEFRGQYHAAAFDFGGGTTDVSIIRVDQSVSGRETNVNLNLVSSWGQRWGGEHLTDFLFDCLLKRCQKAQPQKTILISRDRDGDQEDEDERFNHLTLRDWAEQWKIAASNAKPHQSPLQLRVRRQDGQSEPFSFDDPADGGALTELYVREIRKRILLLIRRLKADLKRLDVRLDFLQLSGKSSIIPEVKELFAQEFRDSGAQLRPLSPSQLKECVVRGACLWTQMTGGGSTVRLSAPDSVKITTSRLRIWDPGKERFHTIIPLSHPLGKVENYLGYRLTGRQRSIEIHESLVEAEELAETEEQAEIGEQPETRDQTDRSDCQVHSFVPEDHGMLGSDQLLTLHLYVGEDFQPHLSATTGSGSQIAFRLEPDRER